MPDVSTLPGWPETRILHLYVPKAPPRPPGSSSSAHPQSKTILTGILRAASGTASGAATVDAVEAVGLSPSEEKSSPKRRRAMSIAQPGAASGDGSGRCRVGDR